MQHLAQYERTDLEFDTRIVVTDNDGTSHSRGSCYSESFRNSANGHFERRRTYQPIVLAVVTPYTAGSIEMIYKTKACATCLF